MLLVAVMMIGVLPTGAFAVGLDEDGNVRFHQVKNSKVSASLLDGAGDYYEQKATYEDDDIVRVSIFLEEKSTIDMGYSTEEIADNGDAMDHRAQLEETQKKVVKAIEKTLGEQLDVQWNLTLVANVISANVRFGQIKTISKIDGVKKVVLETQYAAPESVDEDSASTLMVGSSGMTGTTTAWTSGYTGAGMRIAVIDTGLDTDHQSFANAPYLYALQQNATAAGMSDEDYLASLDLLDREEVAQKLSKLHVIEKNADATAANMYHSDKIPFAFNYVDGSYSYVTHDEDSQTDHGSHVAGIAAANRYIEKDGQMVDALENVNVAGNAPDAQIIVLKVFGQSGGAYTSDYMAAIEDAIILGCDAVNLSLGTSNSGFSDAGDYQQIFESLESSDTVVAIAAGNEGNAISNAANSSYLGQGYLYAEDVLPSTIGSPGSYTNAMTVASADNIKTVMNGFLAFGSGEDRYIPSFNETPYNNMKTFASLDTSDEGTGTAYEYVFLDSLGADSDFDGIDVRGKIVICSRGDLAFYEKAANAVKHGAIATIIYNNVSGTFGMDMTDYPYEAPAISVTKDVGDRIRSMSTMQIAQDNRIYYTGTLTVTGGREVIESKDGYYAMSYFSSWGITGDLTLKPEITAPGGNIYSVRGDVGATDNYKNNSGTSMASPQVAGIAAIAGQFIQTNKWNDKTGFGIRQLTQSLLMSTAVPMKDAKGNYYPLIQQGAGLVNAAGIVGADSFIMMGADATASYADGKVKAELGDDPNKTGIYEFTFTIYNISQAEKTFKLYADVFSQDVTEQKVSADHDYTGYYALQSTKSLESSTRFGSGDQVTVAAGGSAEVKVRIELTAQSKQWLDTYFKKGAYVQAYVYAEPLSDSEGVKTTTHSIPVLAYYGNWTDASMYESGSTYEGNVISNYVTSTTTDLSRYPYATDYPNTDEPRYGYNYLTAEDSNGNFYALGGNPLVKDSYYMPERNAISSELNVYTWYYTPWRDAAIEGSVMKNLTTGEVYYESENLAQSNGNHYSKNSSLWQTYSSRLYVGQTLSDLNEGDQVEFLFYRLPEYYLEDRMGAESQRGSGAELSLQAGVDGTLPTVSKIECLANGKLNVTAADNNYVAAVILYSEDGKQIVSYTGSKTEIEKGEEAVYTLNTASYGGNSYLLQVYDYAMNARTYYIEIDEGVLAYSGVMLAFDMEAGNWIRFDKAGSTMTAISEETKAYTAATAVGDTIYAIAYGTELQKLSVTDPSVCENIGDTGYTLVDLAYNTVDGNLYGITDGSKVVRINTATGKGYLLGTAPVQTNTLACDTTGSFYCNEYGTGKIYSFTLNALTSGDLNYDFNGDGVLNEADGQALLDYLVGSRSTISHSEYADLDHDGDVDTYDVHLLFDRLPERANLIAQLPVKSEYLQAMECDPNNGTLYWASYSTEQVGDAEIGFSVIYGIDTVCGSYTRYADLKDQLSSLVILDKDAGNRYGPLGGVAPLTEADKDKLSDYTESVGRSGAVAPFVAAEDRLQLLTQLHEDTVTVTLTAKNSSYNGLFTLTYDTNVTTLVGVEGAAELIGFQDAQGTVTLGFACNVVIAAGEPLAKVTFRSTDCEALLQVLRTQENNDHISVMTEVDIGAHQWGAWTETAAATCIKDGSRSRTCALCGDVQTEGIPANENHHSWSDWQTVQAADGDEPAIIGSTCGHCGQMQKRWSSGEGMELSDMTYYFNLLSIKKDYITSAKVSDAMVNSIRQIVTADGSLRYLVELSDKTALDEKISVRLESWEASASGWGSAIKREKTENGVGWDESELDYQITLENGIGKMTAYSYYNSTDYTELDLYFYVGEGGEEWMAPDYVEMPDDSLIGKLGIWGAHAERTYWQDKRTDENGNSYYTGYFWLDPDTADDAQLDIELMCQKTPVIYEGHRESGQNMRLCGLSATLENGFAVLKFTAQGSASAFTASTNQYYTIYLRNELNRSPECSISEKTARIRAGDTYALDLSTVFSDVNGDKLTYTVSVNGADAVEASERFTWTAEEAGVYTLVFTADDGLLVSENFTVTLTVLESYISGDVNGDGLVDMKDVTMLKRYLAGAEVEIQTSGSDTNGDGRIDMKDVTLLRRYLAGWDVELQ